VSRNPCERSASHTRRKGAASIFESQPANDPASERLTRRAFLFTSIAAAAGVGLLTIRRPPRAFAEDATSHPSEPVVVVLFSDDGKRLRKITMPKVARSTSEWQKQLSPSAYDIARLADTEVAYSGSLWNQHKRGLYRCICCDTALFSSDTKFESGTGWPSFWAPIAKENVVEQRDTSLGMAHRRKLQTLRRASRSSLQ
jgi:peptide-methionine (R)-S-oxide reductase